jgi:tetratricopeptide (TPR) repeat protein
MAATQANSIEHLIRRSAWKPAQAMIERKLRKQPEDHWLWSRLSGVKYEQRDYQGALEAAEKALGIVPDCPLALWSKAGAVEMLGKPDEAMNIYAHLFHHGLSELKNPDEDANECWEGPTWTASLMVDCMFKIAGCLAKTGHQDRAVQVYRDFLSLVDLGVESIYSREDALKMLRKLLRGKKARHEAAVKVMEQEKELIPG